MSERREDTKGRAKPMAHVRGLRLAAKVACVAGISAAALGAVRAEASEPRAASASPAPSPSPIRVEELFAVKGEGKWDPCGVPAWGPPAPPELAVVDRAEVAS